VGGGVVISYPVESLLCLCEALPFQEPRLPGQQSIRSQEQETNFLVAVGVELRTVLLHCWWECRLVQPLWKKNLEAT
jgi:hypothetical protein